MPKKSKKTIEDALNEHLPAHAHFKPDPKPKTKRPRKKLRDYCDYDVITFGDLIPTVSGYGFVYKVTCNTYLGERYYVGSRHFDAAGDWKYYCTCSDPVRKLIAISRTLPEKCSIKFEVIEIVNGSERTLKAREAHHIMRLYNAVGKDRTINIATPSGFSLRTGKFLGR